MNVFPIVAMMVCVWNGYNTTSLVIATKVRVDEFEWMFCDTVCEPMKDYYYPYTRGGEWVCDKPQVINQNADE